VNPNGMLFGKDSRVDVSGLVATSANIWFGVQFDWTPDWV
jgi:hypothetical protein